MRSPVRLFGQVIAVACVVALPVSARAQQASTPAPKAGPALGIAPSGIGTDRATSAPQQGNADADVGEQPRVAQHLDMIERGQAHYLRIIDCGAQAATCRESSFRHYA